MSIEIPWWGLVIIAVWAIWVTFCVQVHNLNNRDIRKAFKARKQDKS